MALEFKKAVREQVWLKVGINGTSGSGKTFSALRVSTGLVSKCGGEGIAFISTEKSRSKYYADVFDYSILELEEYTPEEYIEAIDAAVNAGFKCIIIDSLSHGWQTLNDIHSKMPGNSFQNWGKLKPRWAKLMQKILGCPAHVLVLSRAKTEWSLEDKNGKSVPTKVGLGAEGDKQQDYEYTVSFMLQQGTHIASVDDGGKDNTGIYDGKYQVLTEQDGIKLYEWANSGTVPASIPKSLTKNEETDNSDELASIKKEIVNTCVAKGGQKNAKLMDILKEYIPSGNPNAFKDIEKAKNCLEAISIIEEV